MGWISADRWPYALSGFGALLGLVLLGESVVYFSTRMLSYSAFRIGALTSVPFVVGLIYGGYWLAESELSPDQYAHIGRWWVAGVVTTVLLISTINARIQPMSTLLFIGTVRWSAAIGGAVGLTVGSLQARAVIRGKEAERARLREQRIEQERDRLDEFASVVSHDLQNPLHTAQGHLELLREECNSPRIDTIERAHDRMSTIIEDTLALARVGQEIDDMEPVELAVAVRTSWEMIEASDATVELGETATVNADRTRLQRLFENLFCNAVEHGGTDVTIRVGMLEDDTGFYVEDDGPGIPDSERGDVFEAGYSTAAENSGFGLRIVEQIVDGHGWDITVTESAAGGARFEVTGVEQVK